MRRATSLALAGARTTDREILLKAMLRSLARGVRELAVRPGGAQLPCTDGLRQAWTVRYASSSRGPAFPGGRAVDVDGQGRLVVREGSDGAGEERAFAAGDVIHLR